MGVLASNINCADSFCSSCVSGYLYRSVSCISLCPSGYLASQQTCTATQSLSLFSLKFYQFLSFASTSIGAFSHPTGLEFQDQSKLSPIPTKNQGFYFESTSQLISSNSWVPAPDFTLRIGVNSIENGPILTISDSSGTIFKFKSTTGKFDADFLLTSLSGTMIKTISLSLSGIWNFIMVKCIQSDGLITLSLSSGLSITEQTLSGYEFRNQLNQLSYKIGGFTGFIHELLFDNSNIGFYDSTYLFSSNGYNWYNVLYNYFSCPSFCSSWPWCVRNSCNVCYSPSCSLCTGFDYYSCKACSNGRVPPDCDLGLNCLAGPSVFNCTECNAGSFAIDGLCFNYVPYGYNPSNPNVPVIDIVFNSFNQYIGGLFQSGNDPLTYSTSRPDADDPYILYNRGVNFDGVSTRLVSKYPVNFNYKFTVCYWVFSRNYGGILSSAVFGILSNSVSGLILSSVSDQMSLWTTKKIESYNNWVFTGFTIDFVENTTIVRMTYGTDTYIVLSRNGYAIYPENNLLYLGVLYDGATLPYDGFIYKLTLWQTAIYDFSSQNIVEQSSLSTCGLSTYYDSVTESCSMCSMGCSAMCISQDCNYCPSDLCEGCDSYIECAGCVTNAVSVGLICQCEAGYYNSGGICSICDQACVLCTGPTSADCTCYENSIQIGLECICNPGFYFDTDQCKSCHKNCATCFGGEYYHCSSCQNQLLESVCLDICPVGYTVNNHRCVVANNLAMKLLFDSIESMKKDVFQGLKRRTEANNSLYSNLGYPDPILAYERGIYFEGNGSFLSYPTTSQPFVLFGPRFFISIWINPMSSTATILYKEYYSLLSLSLKSINNHLMITLAFYQNYNYTSLFSMNLEEWNHVALAVTYTNGTFIQFTINQNQDQKIFFTQAAFLDIVNSTILIGSATYTTDYFKGFIYSLELYIENPKMNSLSSLVCSNCNICLSNNACIPNCNISSFYNQSLSKCEQCLPECNSGCRNQLNCNLCENPLCKKCNDFTSNSCISCKSPYDLIGISCFPCNSTSYYNETLKKCIVCDTLCTGCKNSSACTACVPNSHMTIENMCECDQGYRLNEKCARITFSVLVSINSDNIVTLTFTETLLVNLTSNDIDVFINNIPQDFSLEIVDSSVFNIIVNFNSSIVEGDRMSISFTKPIVSNSNSLLKTTETLSISLFSVKNNDIMTSINSIKTYTKIGITVALSVAFGLSCLNLDLSSFFNFLNIAEVFTYIPAYQIEIDPMLTAFLDSIQIIPGIPNVFSETISESYGIQLPNKFANLNGSTNLFIINSGVNLMILGCFIAVGPAAWLLSRLKLPKNSKIFKKFWEGFGFNIFLRFFIQSCLEFVYNCSMSLLYNDFSNPVLIVDFAISLILIVISIQTANIFTFFLFIGLINGRIKLIGNSIGLEIYNKKFGTFFSEFKENSISESLYYVFFVLRRYTIVISIHLIDSGISQLCISLVFALGISFYLIEVRPYKAALINIYMITVEGLTSLFYIVLMVSTVKGSNLNLNSAAYCCMMLLVVALGSNILSGVISAIIKLHEYLKKKRLLRMQTAIPELSFPTLPAIKTHSISQKQRLYILKD